MILQLSCVALAAGYASGSGICSVPTASSYKTDLSTMIGDDSARSFAVSTGAEAEITVGAVTAGSTVTVTLSSNAGSVRGWLINVNAGTWAYSSSLGDHLPFACSGGAQTNTHGTPGSSASVQLSLNVSANATGSLSFTGLIFVSTSSGVETWYYVSPSFAITAVATTAATTTAAATGAPTPGATNGPTPVITIAPTPLSPGSTNAPTPALSPDTNPPGDVPSSDESSLIGGTSSLPLDGYGIGPVDTEEFQNCQFFQLQNDSGSWPEGLPYVKVLWSVLGDVYDVRVETIYNPDGWIAIGTSDPALNQTGMIGGDIFVSWFNSNDLLQGVVARMKATAHSAPAFVGNGSFPGAVSGIAYGSLLYGFGFQVPVVDWSGTRNLLLSMRPSGFNTSLDDTYVIAGTNFFSSKHQARLATHSFSFDTRSPSCSAPPPPSTSVASTPAGATGSTSATSGSTTPAATTATGTTAATTTGGTTTTAISVSTRMPVVTGTASIGTVASLLFAIALAAVFV